MIGFAITHRIAAGEVVQRPAAAIKELLENALDAGATQIAVTVKGGGLTLLQIQDNGHGIHRDDLAIVCERFTTSKLSNYEDLKSISTFGFRGEALASITHVAHVSILSKTANSNCAYKAKYSDGRLMPIPGSNKADPKPCAGNDGTTITVEDLFYNMSVRKQAFKNSSEEYLKILEVMTKYSVHYGNKGVTITCKKQGQSVPDLHTAGTSSTKEVIKMVYGAQIHRELLHLAFHIRPQESAGEESISDGNSSLEVEVDGFITSANYSSKKGIYVFFINNRLVDCPSIKKVCDAAYSEILPKYAHPFIYLNLR